MPDEFTVQNKEITEGMQKTFRCPLPQAEQNQPPLFVTPVNSANAPLHVRINYEDYDSAPENYITISQPDPAASPFTIAAGATATVLSITVPVDSYLYINGAAFCYYMNVAASTAGFSLWITTDNTATDMTADDSALWYFGSVSSPPLGTSRQSSGWYTTTMPGFSITTGTIYFRCRNWDAVNSLVFNIRALLEVRKKKNWKVM